MQLWFIAYIRYENIFQISLSSYCAILASVVLIYIYFKIMSNQKITYMCSQKYTQEPTAVCKSRQYDKLMTI